MNTNIFYGGDYNPEQWPEEIWEEDLELLKKANLNILTLNVFSWAVLQPSEDKYDFTRLDKIMKLVQENGFFVCLATSTAAHPAWMAKRHPDILRTEINGMKRKFGGRHNSCPNSPTYQKYAPRLAEKLAAHYKEFDNIVAWHVSNEYGGECYCENCEKAFRSWLKEKYHTIKELNRVWNTDFWGHTFYDWDEIVLPNLLSEHFEQNRTMFPEISLDYRRFNSESILHNFQAEYKVLKKMTPHIPITTNLMGAYQALDYKIWGKYMDFISWDNYPSNDDPPAKSAFHHDLMRGVGNGKPFWLMEQTPSVTNWLPYNALKRPGIARLWSYQAIAHGADAVMFFQMRRSVAGCEKLHGAVIDHVGHGGTRVYREIAELGKELKELGETTLGGILKARTALYFDWENWWGIEYSAGPNCELKYIDAFMDYYQALYDLNIPVDIIGTEDELDSYQIIITPTMFMTKTGYAQKLSTFVEQGGTLILTCFSGLVDEHNVIVTGGYPGALRKLAGVWVEETDAQPETYENHFIYQEKRYPAKLLFDICHLEGAQAETTYEEDFYAGSPALTSHIVGMGKVYYMGTKSDERFYHDFLQNITRENFVFPPREIGDADEVGIEITKRYKKQGDILFLLNHKDITKKVQMTVDCVEVLSNQKIKKGDYLFLKKKEVKILLLQQERKGE